MLKQFRESYLVIFGYFVLLFVLWSIWELILSSITLIAFGIVCHEFIGAVLKISLWTIPSICLLSKYKSKLFIKLKEMFTMKITWVKYWLFFLGFAVYNIGGAYLTMGKITIHRDFNMVSLIGTVLFVGITEEMVFRGFLLNTTLPKMKKWTAITLNAIMFLVIHFPIWIYKGIFFDTLLSGGFLLVAALSVVFSVTFIKSKNILVPIALHMFWNLLVCLFFG